jgi:hypothetical protein
MMVRPLPTPWNLYNLTASPYFQETLESLEGSNRPLSIFVGRARELAQLRSKIHGAGELSSRQAVAGNPGVGKTTLVQGLKATLLEDGYLTSDSLVPILASDTAGDLFGRVLAGLYEIILLNRPHTAIGNQAMLDAQLLVRAGRLSTGGANLSILGVGGGVTRGATVITPADIMIDGPRIMRDLMQLVRGSGAHGVVMHLNNLENLSDSETEKAAETLRSLRDPMLMHPGLHFILVGTTDAVNLVVNTHSQVRNTFSTLLLESFEIEDVHKMLEARYAHLCLDPAQPVISPADPAAVASLHELFRGDLRGLLKALDDGVDPLLGVLPASAGPGSPSPISSVRPLTMAEIRVLLHQRYSAFLHSLPDQARVGYLTTWGEKAPESIHTQKSLMKLWGLTQGAVSMALSYLIRQGFVVSSPRAGANPTQYTLSGVSRLIFG